MSRSNEKHIEDLRRELGELQDLQKLPAFVRFSKKLSDAARYHTGAHEDVAKTPMERAEHLHAMKELRALASHVDDRVAELREKIGRALRASR